MGGVRLGGLVVLPTQYIPFVFGHFDSGIGFTVQRVGVLTASPGQDPVNLSTETANSIQTPRLSPDGQWILWTQAGQIRAIKTDGTGETQAWGLGSTGFAAASNPNWKPDSSGIIFCTQPSSGTSPNIWEVPFDGTDQTGNETSLYTDPSSRSITEAFYTYNGAHIVFSVEIGGGVTGIWSMTAAASGAAQLDTQPVTGYNPLIPKFVLGKAHEWIAWNDNTTASPIWKRMDVDGTNVTTLITFAAGYRSPYYDSWAPDDSVLYYARDTLRELWSVTNDGATHTLVYDNGTVAFRESAWSFPQAPDRIYAAENLVSGNYDIWSFLPDGSDQRVEASDAVGHYTLV